MKNTELSNYIFIPIPKRKPRSDTEVCCMCNKRHKLENISACWGDGCQNNTDQGTYCNNGTCYEEHVKSYHPEMLKPDTRKTIHSKSFRGKKNG